MTPLLIGNIAGYLVVCMLYGKQLPLLSAPSIIGIIIGGVIAVVVFPMLQATTSENDNSDNERSHSGSFNNENRKEFREQNKKVVEVANLKTHDALLGESVGLEMGAKGEIFLGLINKGASLPIETIKVSATGKHSPNISVFAIFRGEDSDCRKNNQVCTFAIRNIPHGSVDKPRIETTYFIDANGNLCLSSWDLETDTPLTITIESDDFSI